MSARLLALLGPLSLAADLAAGFPLEAGQRTAIIAARLARAVGADDGCVRDAMFAGLLRYLGCSGAAPEAALLNEGDDRGFLQLFADVDVGRPTALVARATRLASGAPLSSRFRALARLADPRTAEAINRSHCEVAIGLAQSLAVGPAVVAALGQIYERFDGRGSPDGLREESIALPARIMSVAQVIEVTFRLGGSEAALAAVTARSGGQLDPAVVSVFRRDPASVVDGLDRPSCGAALFFAEPAPVTLVPADGRDAVAKVLGLVADLKSTFTLDHSSRVADLACACAGAMGIPTAERDLLRAAGRVHDVGRVALPNRLWDKPGRFDAFELEQAQTHAWWTDRVLGASAVLEPLRDLAAVHERLDGSGYHRRLRATGLPLSARLLAACDVWVALVSERAHRPAMSRNKAAEVLAEDARAGRIDRDAARVVLDEVGRRRPRLAGENPAGLSGREVEVLVLAARGRSNKEIGARLHLAPGTVKNHLASVYERIGVRTRAGAALFAARHDLLEVGVYEE